jgi:hypothetical protein
MHRLRVVLAGKLDDLWLTELDAAQVELLTDVEVLEIAGQWRSVRSSWSR